jgi:hypothetical protein
MIRDWLPSCNSPILELEEENGAATDVGIYRVYTEYKQSIARSNVLPKVTHTLRAYALLNDRSTCVLNKA